MRALSFVALLLLAAAAMGGTILAPVPPKGWNSWNVFEWNGGNFSEAEFRETAQAMAKVLLPFGYDTITVDEFWESANAAAGLSGSIDEYGRALPDQRLWPSAAQGQGFKPMADLAHSLGLQFGIHVLHTIPTDAINAKSPILNGFGYTVDQIAVPHPCPWNTGWFGVNMSHPAGQAYINSLYELYASWDIDFIKNDCTFGSNLDVSNIRAVRIAMDRTGHDFVYSLSPGDTATFDKALLVSSLANLYRVTGDWHGGDYTEHFQIAAEVHTLIQAPGSQGYSWPDLDMLSNTLANDADQRFQMTLWCMARSPLIIGTDIRNATAQDLWYYTNRDLLAINTHSKNNQPLNATASDGSSNAYAWSAVSTTQSDSYYLALFNNGGVNMTVTADARAVIGERACRARDLWSNTTIANFGHAGQFSASLNPHASVVWQLDQCQ
ncbi:uncharacterized protein MONBRDRAFT_23493 [Monosiga brevicollis MX1]|uniref:Alpha-galactosidase n=1 Tax=Monosiga brevicollis TaxID=81824 RepID=A9UTK5_MONBE|nr:uncharacterized protein MONBRDRAFT_23493 [Monosiga brevicollis MX1]EDQ91262.1 predicted protein [Monosiga brevicollis MX1]|eukprot:XP_001743684.1 hypothetical protein [Monosiga brevicollis MX1]